MPAPGTGEPMSLRETADLGLAALIAPTPSGGGTAAVLGLLAAGSSLAVLGAVVKKLRLDLRDVPRCSVLPNAAGHRALRRMGLKDSDPFLSLLDVNTNFEPKRGETGDEYVTAIAACNMPELAEEPNQLIGYGLLDAYGFDTGKIRELNPTIDIERIAKSSMDPPLFHGVDCFVFTEKRLPLREGENPFVPTNCPKPPTGWLLEGVPRAIWEGETKCHLAEDADVLDRSKDPHLVMERDELPMEPGHAPVYLTRIDGYHMPELRELEHGAIIQELLRAYRLIDSAGNMQTSSTLARANVELRKPGVVRPPRAPFCGQKAEPGSGRYSLTVLTDAPLRPVEEL